LIQSPETQNIMLCELRKLFKLIWQKKKMLWVLAYKSWK